MYDKHSEYTKLVDKYEVRSVIKEKLGDDYMFPLLGVWDNYDEIDFEQFGKMLSGTPYHLIFRNDDDKIEILHGVYKSKDSLGYYCNLSNIYKKEVFYK